MADLEDLFSQLKEETQQQQQILLEDNEANSNTSLVRDSKKYNALKEHINKYATIESKPTQKNSNNISLVTDIPVQEKKSKKVRAEERAATSGDNWFNMPKGNANDPKYKKDLMIIQQRAVLDPKRHYKKDKWKVPKYFQVGTVIEDKSEYYSARLKNKERKQTLLQEVLHDKDSTKYFKKKYSEIQDAKAKVVKYKFKKKGSRR